MKERPSTTGTSVSLPWKDQWPISLTLSMTQFSPLITMYASRPPMMPARAHMQTCQRYVPACLQWVGNMWCAGPSKEKDCIDIVRIRVHTKRSNLTQLGSFSKLVRYEEAQHDGSDLKMCAP